MDSSRPSESPRDGRPRQWTGSLAIVSCQLVQVFGEECGHFRTRSNNVIWGVTRIQGLHVLCVAPVVCHVAIILRLKVAPKGWTPIATLHKTNNLMGKCGLGWGRKIPFAKLQRTFFEYLMQTDGCALQWNKLNWGPAAHLEKAVIWSHGCGASSRSLFPSQQNLGFWSSPKGL